MPDPRIFAKFARDIAGWYGDVGRTAEAKILAEAQRTGMEAGRFGSPDMNDGKGFLSGSLLSTPTSVDYSKLKRAGSQQYEPGVHEWQKKPSGWNTFNEDVNAGDISGFDMHSHPPLVVAPDGMARAPNTTRAAQSEMQRGVAGPLAPSDGDFSVWLRHYNNSIGRHVPRPTLRQTAYIQGSQPRSLLAMGSPDFNEGLLPGIDKVAPADLYKIMEDQYTKRSKLWKELSDSSSATDVTKDYGATLPELWASILTNRMAQRGVPMTFEDRAPFGKGWLQDAMSDFYKTSDRRGEGFEQGGPVDTPTEGEGGMYGAPDSMFNTPESLAAALYPQHNTAYADGGPVEMSGGGSELIKRAAGFLRSSRLGDMMNEITNRHGASQGRRFEQASDSANLEHFSDDALRQTFGRSDTGLYTTMPPGRFEDFAARIPDRLLSERPYYKWNHHPDADMLSPNQQSYDEYMRVLKAASEYGGGLDQVPYLNLKRGLPFNQVEGHEGRHRMRMFDEQGDKNSLVHLKPTGGYGLFDDRVERLMKHYFPRGRDTPYMPEKFDVYDSFRPMVQFPNEVFADGGEVEMAGGGADKIKDAVGFLRRLANYKDAPSKHIDDYQWKPMSEVGERLGQIDAIPPHVENFGAFMQEQAQRAANEGLTPRDLLKAFGISRGSIQRSALPTDSIRATGLGIPGNDPTIRPEGAFATWMGTKPGQSWLDKGENGVVDFDAINDAKQRLAPFGKSGDLAQFLQWGPENLPGREGRLSELVDRARTPGNSSPEEWKDAVGDLFGIKLAKRGFFSAMLGRGDQPVFDARQIDLNVPKGNYAGKYERRGNTEGGDEIMARLAARQNALGIGVPKDLMPFQQYLTHHTVWDKLGNEATTHQDLIDSLRGHAEGGPIEMKKGGKSPAMEVYDLATKAAHKLFGSPDKIVEENLVDRAVAASGRPREEIIDALRQKSAGVKGDTTTERGITSLKPTGPISDATAAFSPSASSLPRNIFNPQDWLGHILVGGMSDRAAAGEHLLGVGGTKLRSPLWLPGGSDYPLHHDDLWASDPKALTSFLNAIRNHPDGKNMPALFTNKLMGYQGADQSHMAMKGAVDLLRDADVSRPDANTFRDYARSLKVTKTDPETDVKTTSFPLERFPGIRSDNLEEYLMTLPMGDRSTLIKAMDKASYNKMGIPNPTALRMAITDPALYATPTGTPGRTIGRIDMDNPINMSPDLQHGSYPAGLRGEFLGGLDRIVRPEHWFPDFFENRAKGLDSKGNVRGPAGATHDNRFTARAFMTSPVTQVLDQRWLDQFMPAFNAAKPGWEEGGTVEDQYHPIWQQGFAGGGQPDKYDNAFDVMYPWLSDASRFEPMSPPPPVDPQAHRMAMIAKARARREDQQWQDDPHSYFDSRTAPTGQYLWDGLKQTMLGAASAIPKQIGDMSELANEFISDKIPYYTRADVDSFMDRNGMAPDFEGSRRARTTGTNMGDTIGAFSKLAAKAPGWFNATRRGGTRGMNTGSGLGIAGTFFGGDEGPQYDDLGLNEAVQKRGRFDHGGSVEDQYHPIWSQNFKDGGGVHDILGTLGGLAGNLIPIPVLGPMLGKFAGHTLGNLIEGGSDEIGDDAARDFSFGMADPDAQGWAFGGPIGPTLPKDDFTSGGEEPGMPSFGPGIPGFDVDMLPTNPQVARDRADRQRLMQMTEQASQRGLAQQMKPKDSGGGGGGGMGDIMGMAMKMAPQIMSMMAADGGPVGHYADGGSIPAPNGQQPWMYGGGALMARGGYLSMQEGGAPRAYRDDSGNFTYQGNPVQAGDKYLSEGIPLTWARDDVLGETGSVQPDSMYARYQMRGGKQSDFRNARQLLAGPLFAEGGYLRGHGGMNG